MGDSRRDLGNTTRTFNRARMVVMSSVSGAGGPSVATKTRTSPIGLVVSSPDPPAIRDAIGALAHRTARVIPGRDEVRPAPSDAATATEPPKRRPRRVVPRVSAPITAADACAAIAPTEHDAIAGYLARTGIDVPFAHVSCVLMTRERRLETYDGRVNEQKKPMLFRTRRPRDRGKSWILEGPRWTL
jgi:hypothetical protein